MKNVKKYLILALFCGLGSNLIHASVFDDFNLICKRYETAANDAQRRGALSDAINIMPRLEEHYKNKRSSYDKALGIFSATFGISYEQALLERDGRGTGQLERTIADRDEDARAMRANQDALKTTIQAKNLDLDRHKGKIRLQEEEIRRQEEMLRQEERRGAELQIELGRVVDESRQHQIDNSLMQKEHTKELAKKEQAIRKHQEAVRERDRMIQQKEDFQRNMDIEYRALLEQHEASRERERAIRADIQRLQDERNTAIAASGDREATQQIMQNLQQENAGLIAANTEKEQELAGLRQETAQHYSKIGSLEEENAELKQQMQELQAQLASNGDGKTQDFYGELNRKRLQVEKLQNELLILKSQRVSTASQSERTIEQLKKEIEALQMQNKVQTEAMKSLQDRNKLLEETIEEME